MFIKNMTRKNVLATDAHLCDSLLSRAKGLMFSPKIKDKAFILSFPKEQKIELHMFFVFFPIDVLFLDRKKKIVEIKTEFPPFSTYSSAKRPYNNIGTIPPMIIAFLSFLVFFPNSSFISGTAAAPKNAKSTTPKGRNK